jgi:hypothetical protein
VAIQPAFFLQGMCGTVQPYSWARTLLVQTELGLGRKLKLDKIKPALADHYTGLTLKFKGDPPVGLMDAEVMTHAMP